MTNHLFDTDIQQTITQPTAGGLTSDELLKFIAQPVLSEPNELLLAIEKEVTKNPQSRELFLAMLKKHGL